MCLKTKDPQNHILVFYMFLLFLVEFRGFPNFETPQYKSNMCMCVLVKAIGVETSQGADGEMAMVGSHGNLKQIP